MKRSGNLYKTCLWVQKNFGSTSVYSFEEENNTVCQLLENTFACIMGFLVGWALVIVIGGGFAFVLLYPFITMIMGDILLFYLTLVSMFGWCVFGMGTASYLKYAIGEKDRKHWLLREIVIKRGEAKPSLIRDVAYSIKHKVCVKIDYED